MSYRKRHKRSFSTAHEREHSPPSIRSRTPLPPQSEVVPSSRSRLQSFPGEKKYQKHHERPRSHWDANFDATLSGRSLRADTDHAPKKSPSPALGPTRSPISRRASEDGAVAMPARYVGGPTYSELESDLQAERTKREVLESELNILREEMAAVSSENEALRRETQLVRKEKEAMGRRHGMDASVADVRGRRSGDPRAAIKATRHEPDAAKELPTSKDTVRSNSPKSKRLRMLEEMVECKDIEIASIKDHNKRMEEWNKEQLQKVRDLQNNVNQESEKRRSAEQDLKEVQTETNKIMQDLGMRPKRFTKGKRG